MTLMYDEEEHRNLNRRFFLSKIKSNLCLFLLGIFLFFSPESLNYFSEFHKLTGKILGSLVIIFSLSGCFSTKFEFLVTITGCAVLYFSTIDYIPVVFANSGILGFIIISISLISSKRPSELEVGPTVPENLSYNPSSSGKRLLGTCFTVVVLVAARYFNQFYSSHLFAFFILTCSLSLICNISGGKHRWHTRPLIVLATFIMSLTTTLIALMIFIIYGKIEFISGYVMLLLTTALSFDEMKFSYAYLFGEERKKHRFQTLLKGSEFYKTNALWEEKSTESLGKEIKNCLGGISFPSNLIFVCGVGISFGIFGKMFITNVGLQKLVEVCGLIVTGITTLSFAKSLRILRFFNILPAFLLIISPIVFHILPQSNDFLSSLSGGFVIFLCSLRKGFSEDKN